MYKILLNWMGLFVTLTFMLGLCDLVIGYPMDSEVDSDGIDFDLEELHRTLKELLYRFENSLEGFARNEVCSSPYGKQQFLEDLRTKLCHVNDFFVLEFIENMCKPCFDCDAHNSILRMWIGVLYDLDGDGFIGNDERLRFSTMAEYRGRG